jgi:predicted lysophospholipase L1 biosynthesis ABC-type transport system permease subunit
LSTSVRPPGTNVDFRAHLLPMTASAFDVLDVPLVQGRWASDDPDDREVVINELLAGQIWPDRAALGKRLVVDFDDREVTVVGVTRNAHLRSLSEVTPLVHTPPLDGSPPVILAEQVPALDERLRALVAGVGPELTVTLTPLSSSVIETMENVLVGAGIASGLGSVALLLAVIGVFGVFSYVIEERRKEIGVRLALGAGRREVRAAMLRASRGAILGGLAAGLILSLVAGFALRSYLFGLSPLDPTLRAE